MAEKGFNIQNVKDQTTLSRTTISNLYNNYGSGVQYDTMRQLCELFECEPGDLFKYVAATTFFEIKEIYEENIQMDFVQLENILDNSIDEIEYVSNIHLETLVNGTVIYKGDKRTFSFNAQLDADLEFNEGYTISSISENHLSLYEKLKELKLPYYVENYIENKWNEFIGEWIIDHLENY